ncbi:hypothetical protein VNO77_00709 [Canavalia gladiata]|uniref:Uncharacterized protein n=1 Tax=Canavalia gladiata TaxID=3824 RepID=A0AAN9MPW0_CANGL
MLLLLFTFHVLVMAAAQCMVATSFCLCCFLLVCALHFSFELVVPTADTSVLVLWPFIIDARNLRERSKLIQGQQEFNVTKLVQDEQQKLDGWISETTVRVQNDLGDGTTLYLKCRSKDNDLGQHVLQNRWYYSLP